MKMWLKEWLESTLVHLGYAWRRLWIRLAGRPAREAPCDPDEWIEAREGCYDLDESTDVPMGEVVTFGRRTAGVG